MRANDLGCLTTRSGRARDARSAMGGASRLAICLTCLAPIFITGCERPTHANGAGRVDAGSASPNDSARSDTRDERGDDSSAAGSPKAAPIRVTVVTPRAGGIKRTTTQPGSVQSFEAVALYARVSGFLRNQIVDFGDRVQKGEMLAEVFAPELQSAVNRYEAATNKAQAMVTQAEAAIVARQSEVDAARARRENAQVALKAFKATVTLRNLQYNRISNLAKLKAIEQELVDEQAQKLEVAKADELAGEQAVITADAQVATAEAAVKEAQAALVDAQAGVAVNEAQLDEARQYVGFTAIKAPFDGVVTNRYYFNDDFVRAANGGGNVPEISNPVLRVARTDKFRVVVQLPDSDVPFLRRGEAATVVIDSLPGREFHGVVSRSALAEKYGTRTMHTEVDLLNPDGVLADGMYGDVTIDLQSSEHGVTIPSACLFGPLKEGKRSLYVVRDGRAQHRDVTVGMDTGIECEVSTGLEPGDQVILNRGEGLRDGALVTVTETVDLKSAERSEFNAEGQQPPGKHESSGKQAPADKNESSKTR